MVNLGTNDFSTEPDPAHDHFATGYRALLQRIRQHNPDAFILCITGPMLGEADARRADAAIAAAVTQRHAAGDDRVKSFRHRTPNAAPGCDWHPSVATHRKMAEELVAELRRQLGLASVETPRD
jgi:hypothetical protein